MVRPGTVSSCAVHRVAATACGGWPVHAIKQPGCLTTCKGEHFGHRNSTNPTGVWSAPQSGCCRCMCRSYPRYIVHGACAGCCMQGTRQRQPTASQACAAAHSEYADFQACHQLLGCISGGACTGAEAAPHPGSCRKSLFTRSSTVSSLSFCSGHSDGLKVCVPESVWTSSTTSPAAFFRSAVTRPFTHPAARLFPCASVPVRSGAQTRDPTW